MEEIILKMFQSSHFVSTQHYKRLANSVNELFQMEKNSMTQGILIMLITTKLSKTEPK